MTGAPTSSRADGLPVDAGTDDRVEPAREAGVRETVAAWLAQSRATTVLTGAGISTESGIPDFRGPEGVWTRDPGAQRMFRLQDYVADPDLRARAWRSRTEHAAWSARPNAGHAALVELERSGTLVALATQNIDELHQRAGSSPGVVLELHGTLFSAVCLACRRRTVMADELARVAAGDPDPACRACGGILKSATVSFGERLDPDVLRRAHAAASRCELFLAVGSSLTVQPAAGLCRVAVAAGARLVVLNAEPTPYDGLASAVVRAPLGEVLPALLSAAQARTAGQPSRAAASR